MGVTYFLEILFTAVMLLISAVSVTAAVILLLVRVYKKRRDEQVKRVYTVLPAIFFTFAALCILPAVGIIGNTRSVVSELDNHRSYGETLTQSADGSFRLGEDGYRLVNCCALSDSAVLGERIANLIPSDSLLARLYFNIGDCKCANLFAFPGGGAFFRVASATRRLTPPEKANSIALSQQAEAGIYVG